ncbi:MAG: hypothetical protein OEY95_02565 [Candidatus Bathyarchaeota archaeon]|nr:hypothetical protein [Candidatus Bathyarchaeota archaeon]
MAEEKKGHAKICIDIEINEALMEIIKESMKNMPQMMKMMGERRRKSE